jgi:hypothetical protein
VQHLRLDQRLQLRKERMAETARGHEKNDRKDHADDHCILCETIIEIGDHEIYFATGYCRYCHEAAEEPAEK